jgi:hypothetical protein
MLYLQSSQASAERMGIKFGPRQVSLHGPVSARLERNRSQRVRCQVGWAPGVANCAARLQGQFVAGVCVCVERGKCGRQGAQSDNHVHIQKWNGQ